MKQQVSALGNRRLDSGSFVSKMFKPAMGLSVRLPGSTRGSLDMSAGVRAPVRLTRVGLLLLLAASSSVLSSASQTPSASTGLTVTISGSDTTPPVISLVAASSVTSSGATITWTTNKLSDSLADYG